MIDGKNYVDKAETVITSLISDAKKNARDPRYYQILTTSQIRKQLAMTAELFARAQAEQHDVLSDEIQSQIEYLRVQFVYQAGRDKCVKQFVEKAEIMKILNDIKGCRQNFLTFCRYMEALVAYRKFYGNEDK